jgi:N-acetylglucosaminyldiphosphoundecaprenol N-acetyl-beta-D-mannosaminyltransferase
MTQEIEVQTIEGAFDTYSVLGVKISATSLESASDAIINWCGQRKSRAIGVRDTASTMAMADNRELLELSNRTEMNLPDGMPLVWIGKKRGFFVERTCGPDLMDLVLMKGRDQNLKHFFWGGKEGVAKKLAEVYEARLPGIQIVGTVCPPFRRLTVEEDSELVKIIHDSNADILWIGISSPKQDIWMDQHIGILNLTMIGVGAAFDLNSGNKKRAPKFMRKIGLEWTFRLIQEPERLWRRYLILIPRFFWKILWYKDN